jgi:hypothetical protein
VIVIRHVRQAATERLKETAASVGSEGISASPEALPIRDQTTYHGFRSADATDHRGFHLF